MKSITKATFGDFQTPPELAEKVVSILKTQHGFSPAHIIEPSCGKGAFLQAAERHFPTATLHGYDINPQYVHIAQQLSPRATIQTADFFAVDWRAELSSFSGETLILGNPPWVTNSALGTLNKTNTPKKTNFHGRTGMQALTGASNFDISEWMLLEYLRWLESRVGAIAILCKTAVARKVIAQLPRGLASHIYPIDTKYYFSADVEACLLVLTRDSKNQDCQMYSALSATPARRIGMRDGMLISDIDHYQQWRHLAGEDEYYIWRSGIKHDCAKVMELSTKNNHLYNGFGEPVDIEAHYLFPLLKGSDVACARVQTCRKKVIVPQKTIGAETADIAHHAPKTWAYLTQHGERLDRRKSTIYRDKPRFSIFGVGDYSFTPWKVAIAGLYKKLHFQVVAPIDGQPVLFDDTVYFLPCQTQMEAQFIHQLLTSPPAMAFLSAHIFWDDKRPITAKILKRLSLRAVAEELGYLTEFLNLGRHFPNENKISNF